MHGKANSLRAIGLHVPVPPPSLADFYENCWGLAAVPPADRRRHLFRATGPDHHVLELSPASARGLHYLELGAPDEACVDRLFEQAGRAGARTVEPPARLDREEGGYGFELLDPENRLVRVASGVQQWDDAAAIHARPVKLSHVVLNSPDIESMQRFYCAALGFELSDRSEDQMVFIRCGNDRHHQIAFNKNPYPSLNHVSFEHVSKASVLAGIDRMADAGHPIQWGAGCHGIGQIMFAYFVDPVGFVIEYTHYMAAFDGAGHVPRTWPRSPQIMDAWGTAGPPSAFIRTAMAGSPEGGHQAAGGGAQWT